MSKIFQQGDVILKLIESIPDGKREPKPKLVLAYGEVTGHKHQIVYPQIETVKAPKPQIEFFSVGGKDYVSAPFAFTVRHEEHGPIEVPAGNYEVKIVREYDHFTEEARDVQD